MRNAFQRLVLFLTGRRLESPDLDETVPLLTLLSRLRRWDLEQYYAAQRSSRVLDASLVLWAPFLMLCLSSLIWGVVLIPAGLVTALLTVLVDFSKLAQALCFSMALMGSIALVLAYGVQIVSSRRVQLPPWHTVYPILACLAGHLGPQSPVRHLVGQGLWGFRFEGDIVLRYRGEVLVLDMGPARDLLEPPMGSLVTEEGATHWRVSRRELVYDPEALCSWLSECLSQMHLPPHLEVEADVMLHTTREPPKAPETQNNPLALAEQETVFRDIPEPDVRSATPRLLGSLVFLFLMGGFAFIPLGMLNEGTLSLEDPIGLPIVMAFFGIQFLFSVVFVWGRWPRPLRVPRPLPKLTRDPGVIVVKDGRLVGPEGTSIDLEEPFALLLSRASPTSLLVDVRQAGERLRVLMAVEPSPALEDLPHLAAQAPTLRHSEDAKTLLARLRFDAAVHGDAHPLELREVRSP